MMQVCGEAGGSVCVCVCSVAIVLLLTLTGGGGGGRLVSARLRCPVSWFIYLNQPTRS